MKYILGKWHVKITLPSLLRKMLQWQKWVKGIFLSRFTRDVFIFLIFQKQKQEIRNNWFKTGNLRNTYPVIHSLRHVIRHKKSNILSAFKSQTIKDKITNNPRSCKKTHSSHILFVISHRYFLKPLPRPFMKNSILDLPISKNKYGNSKAEKFTPFMVAITPKQRSGEGRSLLSSLRRPAHN